MHNKLLHHILTISQVIDILNAISLPVEVDINITHVNHPPVARVLNSLPLAVTMNSNMIVQIIGTDVDLDLVSVFITQLPSQGQLSQLDGTIITSASPANPAMVTNFLGKVIYPSTVFYCFSA